MTRKILQIIPLALLMLCAHAWAGSIDMSLANGHVVFGKGNRTTVWGYGISILSLMDGGKALDLSSGSLFFTTARSDGFSGNTLFFGPGGEFAIRGCVEGDPHSGSCGKKNDVRGYLMTGSFLYAKLIKEGSETIFVAQFLEKLNPALAALMHLPAEAEGELEMIMGPGTSTRTCLIDDLYGGSLSVLSEPASIAVLLSSLAGMIFVLRFAGRRQRARVRT
jgi:hypothetical protein